MPEQRIAVLGAGRMGETLIRAWTASDVVSPGQVVATARSAPHLERLRSDLGVEAIEDNREAAEEADLIFLCVKPQIAESVLAELREIVGSHQVVLSILAGVGLDFIESRLGPGSPVVRAMPNTPSLIGVGMTALCGGRHATPEQLETAVSLFKPLGRALVLEEKYFDAVTGLSASGPAFIYIVIEALAEGGVKVGLPRHVATELAAQTCLGAGQMVIETGEHPATLKDVVTTPAGCTIDGILKLEEGGLRVTLIKAVVEATQRARELVR